jgi:hypothetical protein
LIEGKMVFPPSIISQSANISREYFHEKCWRVVDRIFKELCRDWSEIVPSLTFVHGTLWEGLQSVAGDVERVAGIGLFVLAEDRSRDCFLITMSHYVQAGLLEE